MPEVDQSITVLTKNIKPKFFNYWAFILSSLVLLFLALFSLVWFQKQKNAADWIAHTYLVKLKIEKCFGSLLEAESNQRGFLLSKDPLYLKNIEHAELILQTSIKQLDSLVADNPAQLKNQQRLTTLVLARLSRLHVVLDSSQYLNNSFIPAITISGRIIMDSIHNQVRVMQAAEDELLRQRKDIKHTQDNRVFTFVLLFSILSFTILMLSFLKIKNENSLRLKAQSDASLLEKLVKERTVEIKNINDLLQNQNEKLERKNLDLTSFTNIASHDLKEPLRKIEMFISRITQLNPENLSGKSLEYFGKISQQAKRMQNLIDSILQYAQADDETLGFQYTSLTDTANLALESLSEKIKEKNASIHLSPLPTITCNPVQMEQVFTNLIDNSLKYAKPGEAPVLHISATTMGENGENDSTSPFSWKIDFSDNGIGFDETYKDKIFEIFQRLHAKDEYTGTGIGLAICKKIIENHRGRISSNSRKGAGSVFSIILPST